VLDINLGRGRLGHSSTSTHTLLVTDAVLAVPEDPPAVVQLDPYPLLFHARDDALDVGVQHVLPPEGWQRISLFAFTSDQAH